MAGVTIASLLVIAICLRAASPSQVSVQLDEQAIKNSGFPNCRLRARSNATNKQTIWVFSGESVTFNVCLPENAEVHFADLRFSNDGWADVVSVYSDGQKIGALTSTDQSKEGNLWDVFHKSGLIGKTYLAAGEHTITVTLSEADKWGIELDELALQFDKYWTEDDIKCPDANDGGHAPSPEDFPCLVDETGPMKAMMSSTSDDNGGGRGNTGVDYKTTTLADVGNKSTPASPPKKTNSSVTLTNPGGDDMTLQRANASFCSRRRALFEVVSTVTTQITLTVVQSKPAPMTPHRSFRLPANPLELYASLSSMVHGYPGNDDEMWVSMDKSDAVPCSAVQLSAPDGSGDMTSRFILRSDGGVYLFPGSNASSQVVFYPSVPSAVSGQPEMTIASAEVNSNGSAFEVNLKTEQADMKIGVRMDSSTTNLTFLSGFTRVVSLSFPCATKGDNKNGFYVAGDDGEFYSMFGNWKSIVGTKLQLRMESD